MERPRALSEAMSTLDQYDKPSVAVAKEWQEQVILPRRFYDEKTNTYRLVEMGEDSTGSELFPVWGTSLADLSVFGIGIGLYFRMLLHLSLLMFVLAVVSMPTIDYFLSDDYSGALLDRKLDIRIWGSAACTRQDQKTLSNGETKEVNRCPLIVSQLYVDMIGLVILSVYIIVAAIAQDRTKKLLDEMEQTAADYSIVVKDPDANAWNPDEWEIFFSQFGKVKFVTVSVDNHKLLSALAHKRYMEEMLKMESSDQDVVQMALQRAEEGPVIYERPLWKRFLQKFMMYRDLPYWESELYHQRKYIEKLLLKESCPVWSVFIMFETEEAQRKCLQEMKVGLCETLFDSSLSRFPKRLRFRGRNILRIEQAVEPSSVQWKNVGVRWRQRVWQQIANLIIVGAMMVGIYCLMAYLKETFVGDSTVNDKERRSNLYILAYSLAVTDKLGCKVLSYLDLLEQHQTKEREQLSTLNKLLIFRTFNGAIVIYLLMDFTDMLSQQNLLQIQAVLIANLITTPVLQLLSLYDRFMQWVYGPKAKTQKKLNQYYSGYYWKIAERYTDITKIVGTALFYKSILPTGVLITSFSLLMNYWVDKYCLLRMWKVPPRYDGLLARASRYHLLLMALTSLIMMGHWYDGWPFDRETEIEVQHLRRKSQSTIKFSVMKTLRLIFPLPRHYNSKEQTELMSMLCTVIVVVTLATVGFVVIKSLYRTWGRYIVGSRQGRNAGTRMSEIPCSQVKYLNGYVPSYESWYSDFPYLCVALDQFEHRFINWSGEHSNYCLVNDATEDPILALYVGERPLEQLFGACKQYDLPLDGKRLECAGSTIREDYTTVEML